MTMAATFESRSALMRTGSGAIEAVHVDVFRDMAQVESVWRSCESDDYLTTPYQRFDLLNAWQCNVGAHEGVAPFIVVVRDRQGDALLVLPLAVKHENSANVARFLGGKHTTFNMGLWRRDFADATKDDLDAVIRVIAANGVDVLALTQQPGRWRNIANPLLMYPSQLSPNDCPLLKTHARQQSGGQYQQQLPPPSAQQGAQAAGAARHSLSSRIERCGHRPSA